MMSEREDPIQAVHEVLERIRIGMEHLDMDMVLDCFDHGSEVVVVGTDLGEYWMGFEAFEEPFRRMGTAFSDATYWWDDGNPVVVARETWALASGSLNGRFSSESGEVTLPMRTTHAFEKRADGWKILQAHYSLASAEVISY